MASEKEITIHNKILSNYRSIHVDGAYGGITSRGFINLSFFSERSPIPQSSSFKVTTEGQMGELIKHSAESKDGILREFQVGVYMDIEIARALVNLLSVKISEIEKVINK